MFALPFSAVRSLVVMWRDTYVDTEAGTWTSVAALRVAERKMETTSSSTHQMPSDTTRGQWTCGKASLVSHSDICESVWKDFPDSKAGVGRE